MPQFALYRTRHAAARVRVPLLLATQSDLSDPLATRIVVPLSPTGTARSRFMQSLTPLLAFEGKK